MELKQGLLVYYRSLPPPERLARLPAQIAQADTCPASPVHILYFALHRRQFHRPDTSKLPHCHPIANRPCHTQMA